MDIKDTFSARLLKVGMAGGVQGVISTLNSEIYGEILDWAIRHKERSEVITKQVLVDKMKSVFNKGEGKVNKLLFGYTDKAIESTADSIMEDLNRKDS